MLPESQILDLGPTASYGRRVMLWVPYLPGNPFLGMAVISVSAVRAGSRIDRETYLVGLEAVDGGPPVFGWFRQTGEFTPDRPGTYTVRPTAGGWRCSCLGERGHRSVQECRHATATAVLIADGLVGVLEPAEAA